MQTIFIYWLITLLSTEFYLPILVIEEPIIWVRQYYAISETTTYSNDTWSVSLDTFLKIQNKTFKQIQNWYIIQ